MQGRLRGGVKKFIGLQAHAGALWLQEHTELAPLILRKFKSVGDVELAQRLVFSSQGIQRAKELAAEHALLAVEAVRALPHDEHAGCCADRVCLLRVAYGLKLSWCGVCRCATCRLPQQSMPDCAARRLLTSQSGF